MHCSDSFSDSTETLLNQYQICIRQAEDLHHFLSKTTRNIYLQINLISTALPTTTTISSIWPLLLPTTTIRRINEHTYTATQLIYFFLHGSKIFDDIQESISFFAINKNLFQKTVNEIS